MGIVPLLEIFKILNHVFNVRKLTLEDVPEHIKPALSLVEWNQMLLWDESCRIIQNLMELVEKLSLYWDCFLYEDADEIIVEISIHINRFREINKEMKM